MVCEEKLEGSVKPFLNTCGDHATVEKLRALLGNKSYVEPIIKIQDNIAVKAKEQLSCNTELMNQTNKQTIMDNINRQITEYSKALRLPIFRRDYKELAQEADKERIELSLVLG